MEHLTRASHLWKKWRELGLFRKENAKGGSSQCVPKMRSPNLQSLFLISSPNWE